MPGEDQSLVEVALRHLDANGLHTGATVLVWLLLLLLRWLVGLHSYSGAQTPPMFGDYEAQRHWMEITLNLPVSQWYFNTTENDLLYWGLDYPPLTAYVSYLFGVMADRIEPEMVALKISRGYEDASSKVFMRTSVIFCDILLFIPVIFYVAQVLYQRQQWTQRMALPLIVLSQPALLLIDHGHFQV
jgi:alpha-1,3-glucosyltransferase